MKYVILYQQRKSSNLIGWKLEVGVESEFIWHDKDQNSALCFIQILFFGDLNKIKENIYSRAVIFWYQTD